MDIDIMDIKDSKLRDTILIRREVLTAIKQFEANPTEPVNLPLTGKATPQKLKEIIRNDGYKVQSPENYWNVSGCAGDFSKRTTLS